LSKKMTIDTYRLTLKGSVASMIEDEGGLDMLKSVSLALALFATCAVAVGAQASTISYNLVLTPLTGSTGGTGSFSVTGPIDSFFQNFTTSTGLLSLDFLIGGHQFSLGPTSLGNENVTFVGGNLFGIQYSGFIQDIGQSLSLSLNTSGLTYSYGDAFHPSNSASGIISASAAPSPVPLPGALPLFATGIGAWALLGWRRKKKTTVAH